MFAYLDGTLADKRPTAVVIDCGGVGYDVAVPMSTFDKLVEVGERQRLWIHPSFADDGVRLFGFATTAERELFRMLIGVSGIGPKLALAALSGLSVNDLATAVHMGDAALIAQVPGLGKKTAERLIVDLRDKLTPFTAGADISLGGTALTSVQSEAEAALITLGYSQQAVHKAWKKLLEDNDYTDAETLVKATIQHFYKKR